MAVQIPTGETAVGFKKAYLDFPSSSITDGTTYVSLSGEAGSPGPNYSERLGSDGILKLDTDKVYTVQNPGVTPPPAGQTDGTGTYTGTISGLDGYFNGLKFIYDLSTAPGTAGYMKMQLNSMTGGLDIYDYNGENIDAPTLRFMGPTLMQYSDSIPNSDDPSSPKTGVQVISFDRDLVYLIGDYRYLKLSGGLMTGDINMNNHKVTNVPTPEVDKDAVNKSYVDTIVSGLEDEIESLEGDIFGVASPDPYLDSIDGSTPVSYVYMTVSAKDKVEEINHNILKLTTAMQPNTCIHVFAYCNLTSTESASTGPNTYNSSNRVFIIPHRICGGVINNGTPTANDYTWINGEPGYIGAAGTGASAVESADRQFTIPARGMVEISIFYNTFTISNTQYSRTVVKCDGEEVYTVD